MLDTAEGRRKARSTFFNLLFGKHSGLFNITLLSNDTTERPVQHYFKFPEDVDSALDIVEASYLQFNVYFCPQLLKVPKLNKENIDSCPSLWADLDECDPENMKVPPSIVIQSSPGRYQAVWVLEDPIPPVEGELLSKRIAYYHADEGCDRSGWDLSQLLRVPNTYNYKRVKDTPDEVVMVTARQGLYRPDDFSDYPEVRIEQFEEIPFPDSFPEEHPESIIQRFKGKIQGPVFDLYSTVPQDKEGKSTWSETLWKLMRLCFEGGMSREEAFIVADRSACNKFARDGRGSEYLWRDICRAWIMQEKQDQPIQTKQDLEALLTPEEKEHVAHVETFVERYIEWAAKLGDAAVAYHQAGGFVILSSLLAGRVRLPTSFGTIVPNLWFMILADTTLTRKSTAMDMAVDLLADVEDDAIMATDGSLEGLLQALSMRPGIPSIFLRDEFSGLLEAMTKRDYYAGMAEMLTKLYDCKMSKRLLKKETIEVRDPVLITFAGGIRNRVQQLLKLDHISSGFIPRFVFITAVSDPTKVQPLGPPTLLDTTGRQELIDELMGIKEHYSQQLEFVTPQGHKTFIPRKWDAELAEDAWVRYNAFEQTMLQAGVKSDRPDLMTPLYARLAVSTLKAIILLAASRQRKDHVVIELDDVLLGIKYCEGWREYAIEVINGVGKSVVEGNIERIYENIKRNPGINRSTLMQHYHLTAREADIIFTTLEQRGLVTPSRMGRGVTYHVMR